MASEPAGPLQVAIVEALRTLETAAGDRVYDRVPPKPAFPYISIGPADGTPVTADCYDGTETFQQIDIWSREVGFPQCKAITDAVRTRFHEGVLTVEGHTVEILEVASTRYLRDPDGLTQHGVVLLRVQTQPVDPAP